MKFKATYYDMETNKLITKSCVDIDHCTTNDNFSFSPFDNPTQIYKSITIDHPKVSIYQNDLGIRINVTGYQRVKDYGYARTKTVIEIVRGD